MIKGDPPGEYTNILGIVPRDELERFLKSLG
jgi:hypothetical protein